MFDTNYTYKYGGISINDLEVKDEVFAIDDTTMCSQYLSLIHHKY